MTNRIIQLKVFYLYALVFVSGFSVLCIEILGTRILAPFFGLSLFLWSALIAVTLIALSVGYSLGGRWVDRKPSFAQLCWLLITAGVAVLLIPFAQESVVSLFESLNLRAGVLLSSLVLFAPSLTIMGMVTPFAIRLRVQSVSHVGRVSGNLSALSTVASVISALLTGFFFIPYMGVSQLTFGVGLLLLAFGVTGLFLDRSVSSVQRSLGGGLLGLGLIFALFWEPNTVQADGSVVLDRVDSPYAEIKVIENQSYKTLSIDGDSHSEVFQGTEISSLPYTYVVDSIRRFFESPGKMALVGLGAGIMVADYVRAGWEVDAIEIDEYVTEFARRYFQLIPPDMEVFHIDGRRHFREVKENQKKKYDLVIVDAFGSSTIPFHLVTKEAFSLIQETLSDRGILVVNFFVESWDSRLLRSVSRTIRSVGFELLAVPTHSPSEPGNILLLGSKQEMIEKSEFIPRFDSLDRREAILAQVSQAWENSFRIEQSSRVPNSGVITDDLNPIDVWSDEINYVSRKLMKKAKN